MLFHPRLDAYTRVTAEAAARSRATSVQDVAVVADSLELERIAVAGRRHNVADSARPDSDRSSARLIGGWR
ncbi:hypothetical protein ACE1N8_34170 (plasmid) [Streptomyces sp. DSM 116494]|uniref:hypothetical protein n=1 Tax=Streptomyces okerensis TaxID=3344655 RepID=UPI00388F7601